MRCALALTTLLLGALATPAAAECAHVYVVVVDGFDPRFLAPDTTPRLLGLAAAEPERTSVFPTARGVMPARTNANHVSLLTGTFAEVHGIVGNVYWDRAAGALAKLDRAALIEVETLFTVIETTAPALRTVGLFGKPKLGRLFTATDRQRAPDVLRSGAELGDTDAVTGYARDAATMAALAREIERAEPDLAVVNLADVDRSAHGDGPEAPGTAAAIRAADAAVGALVDLLRARGAWERSVLVVTADHGFTTLTHEPNVSLTRALGARAVRGVHLVGDGSLEYAYREAGTPVEVLARIADRARAISGVAGVFARAPVPGVPRLAEAHPEWRLDHEHTGDLLLIASSGHQFIDPGTTTEWRLRGNHGGPENTLVPLVVTGGHPALRAVAAGDEPPRTVDLAPTIALLLGLRAPERLDGTPIASAARGRPLPLIRPETASRGAGGRECGAGDPREGRARPATPAPQN